MQSSRVSEEIVLMSTVWLLNLQLTGKSVLQGLLER